MSKPPAEAFCAPVPGRTAAEVTVLAGSAAVLLRLAGISVPVIGVGLLTGPIGPEGAGLVFIVCVAVLVSAAAVHLVRRSPVARV
ncbi:hypothetical protein ACF1G5_13630 [Streptomyces coeruleorubidus]|uniref:hypothetical protein n=1 Tax=Streptomyces coeruleorubidus TaxID=116188 RepID=UPI0036FF7F84